MVGPSCTIKVGIEDGEIAAVLLTQCELSLILHSSVH